MPISHECSYVSAGLTHPGQVRQVNQDAFVAMPEIGVWLVADGVGGHLQGEMASKLLVEAVGTISSTEGLDKLTELVRGKILTVNEELVQLAHNTGPDAIFGSTVAALIVQGSECVCVWAGDSRVYGLRRGRLTRLTRDHSPVEDLVEHGTLSRSQAMVHPQANVIYRAVGKEADLELDARLYDVHAHDRFLLCTDGLIKEASDSDITEHLSADDCRKASEALLELALQRGGHDNISIIVVDIYPNV